jgi:predicted 3-demethylubiquinone-9 3-methyltransferase (glyoxalase superfamily)
MPNTPHKQKITTFLWFDDQAEEAARFYTSVFPDSRIVDVAHYSEVGPGVPGTVMTVDYELSGQRFTALNGGPHFTFTEAISLQVDCDDQAEVDYYWTRLTEGGEGGQCGWLKDRYGLSWQIVPRQLLELAADPDRTRADRVIAAMLRMGKLDIQGLIDAHEGR